VRSYGGSASLLLARSVDNLGGAFSADGRVDARGLIEGRVALGEHYTVEIAAVPQATRRAEETAAMDLGTGPFTGDPVRRLTVRASELDELADRLPINDGQSSHLLRIAHELRSIAAVLRQARVEAPAC
jgi:hypothetical protein